MKIKLEIQTFFVYESQASLNVLFHVSPPSVKVRFTVCQSRLVLESVPGLQQQFCPVWASLTGSSSGTTHSEY